VMLTLLIGIHLIARDSWEAHSVLSGGHDEVKE
jgi:hypothetical protein